MKDREAVLSETGKMIIEGARSDLYVAMRYMDLAIFALEPTEDDRIDLMAADGRNLFYKPEDIVRAYKEDRRGVNRALLHSILHCLFRHVYNSVKYTGGDSLYWDIACDIAAEHIIDDIKVSAVSAVVSRYRTYIYKRLSLDMEIFTAEGIYKTIKGWELSDSDFKILYKVFRTDDHGFWYGKRGGDNAPPSASDGGEGGEGEAKDSPPQKEAFAIAEKMNKTWEDLSRRTMSEALRLNKAASDEERTLLLNLKASNRRRYDYREFLKRFAVYGEEAKPDPDSYDINFYTYGLSLYGNMPLIEPNEYRETKKISDFIVVLDTSASCSGDAVKAFLNETFGLLKLRENFFNRVNIHVIQCDNKVRRDTLITCGGDIDRLLSETELTGFGGTDFRPAFEYAEKLGEELTNLKGLIYFTDGEGIYPVKPPPFETAFVFLKEHYYDAEVPPWAIKLILDNDDLKPEPHTLQ